MLRNGNTIHVANVFINGRWTNTATLFLYLIVIKTKTCLVVIKNLKLFKITTRGPRGNAHLRQKIFKSSLFVLLYVQQATSGRYEFTQF